VSTSKKTFRELLDEITMLMGYEVTRDLPLEPIEIDTPLERMRSHSVSGKKLTLVPILRAGLGMVEGMQRLMPNVRVGHIGLYRDHETLEPVDYYFKIPPEPEARDFVVLDPMLATGGSICGRGGLAQGPRCHACPHDVPRRSARRCRAHAARTPRRHDLHRCTGPRAQPDKGYILPGLGDAGDRLFGTR
jgi:uracil phosphoribosyltransferase